MPQIPLFPSDTTRCLPRLQLDRDGQAIYHPAELLGVDSNSCTTEDVQKAYAEKLMGNPSPEVARQLRQARDLLTTAEGRLELLRGEIYIPSAPAWELSETDATADLGPGSAMTRLLGQALLYAMVEDQLWNEGLSAEVDGIVAELEAQGVEKER